MKKIVTIVLLYFIQMVCNAQSPIQVNITGFCSTVSGTYLFTGLVNGKNNYAQTFLNEGVNVTIAVGFDGTKWVLYGNNDLTDPGFINLAINGLLPPLTGWSIAPPDGCPDGTMTISTTLSINNDFVKSKDLVISPNPSNNDIIISNSEKTNSYFEYKIYDTTGRKVDSGESKFESKIEIETLENGSYFIRIVDEKGSNSVKKFIKN